MHKHNMQRQYGTGKELEVFIESVLESDSTLGAGQVDGLSDLGWFGWMVEG